MDFFTGNPAFANEKPDYLLVTRTVVPELLAAGATQPDVDQMMIENPRRFLAREA
jgi:predicted metal-dependent phosphotriesterase family hydrolase